MQRLFTKLVVLCLLGSLPTLLSASWLSNLTGINIDVPKSTVKIDEPIKNAKINQLPPILPVSATDRRGLVDKLTAYHAATDHVASVYSNISLGVVLGSILLGLSASIAGFCKASRTAGVLSILATGVLGIGNAFPINQNADFYRLLSAQSNALVADAELRPTMNLGEYATLRDGLKTLILFEGERFPSRAGTQQATQDLLTQLASLSTHAGSLGSNVPKQVP